MRPAASALTCCRCCWQVAPQAASPVDVHSLAESVWEELIDEISRGLCHRSHRAAKLGYLSLEESAAQE